MKKIVILALALLTFSQAAVLNGIAMVVEGEPVTLAEIRAVQQQMGVSRDKAKDMLIENRLQKAAMKNIIVSQSEIDERIKLIAKQNNFTIEKLQSMLKTQHITWKKFREQMELSIKKQRFYSQNISNLVPDPSDTELKRFYAKSPSKFKVPSRVSVIEYRTSNEEIMKNFLLDPKKSSGIQSRKVTLGTANITSSLMDKLLSTRDGAFTAHLNDGKGFVAYKVLSKSGSTSRPFADIRSMVASEWKVEQKSKAVDDYFKKMKSSASIVVIRP